MRILYITQQFQHPSVRGSTRSYHLLKKLSGRHQITLLTIARTPIPPSVVDEISDYLEQLYVIDNIFTHDPKSEQTPGQASPYVRRHYQAFAQFLSARKARSRRFAAERHAVTKMKQVFVKLVSAGSYDLVLFHGSSVFGVIEDWNDLPIVIDFGDADSHRLISSLRYTDILDWAWLLGYYRNSKRLERKLQRKTPYIAFISCRDRNAVIGPNKHASVVPIGVDLDYWRPRRNQRQSNTIVFTGVMDYRPNDDAAIHLVDRIVPLVKRAVPELQVWIVGRNPSTKLKRRTERYPHIEVTGFVDDVRPFLERATVFVAPLRFASGTQNKVLEALAMQIPVVCTPIVAEGLRGDDVRRLPVCVARGTAQIVGAIVKLLGDQTERSRLSALGRPFVRAHFDWNQSAHTLEALCCQALTGHERQATQALQVPKTSRRLAHRA